MSNYYLVLGVAEDASPEEVREAYRRLAKKFHPDVSGSDTSAAFREVQDAWDTLGDVALRRQYDETMRRGREERFCTPSFYPRAYASPTSYARTPTRDEDALHLELSMTPTEAARGGDLPFALPVLQTCAGCRGTGRYGFFCCPACIGQGYQVYDRPFTLHIPPGLRHGELLTVPLSARSLLRHTLVLHVTVG